MIDFEKIDNLLCEEVSSMKGLFELATSAETAAGVIQRTYSFEDAKDIEVYSYNGDKEILTREMVWQARFKDWSFDVECTPDGIFKFYKKLFWDYKKVNETPETKAILENASEHFRYFVIRTYHHT